MNRSLLIGEKIFLHVKPHRSLSHRILLRVGLTNIDPESTKSLDVPEILKQVISPMGEFHAEGRYLCFSLREDSSHLEVFDENEHRIGIMETSKPYDKIWLLFQLTFSAVYYQISQQKTVTIRTPPGILFLFNDQKYN